MVYKSLKASIQGIFSNPLLRVGVVEDTER